MVAAGLRRRSDYGCWRTVGPRLASGQQTRGGYWHIRANSGGRSLRRCPLSMPSPESCCQSGNFGSEFRSAMRRKAFGHRAHTRESPPTRQRGVQAFLHGPALRFTVQPWRTCAGSPSQRSRQRGDRGVAVRRTTRHRACNAGQAEHSLKACASMRSGSRFAVLVEQVAAVAAARAFEVRETRSGTEDFGHGRV